MKKGNVGIIVLTLFLMVAWSSLMIGGCGGDDGSDTNPFVWPKLEYKDGRTMNTGLERPIAIVMDRTGGALNDTKYWYICNQGTAGVANDGYITRVRYGQFAPDAGDTFWVTGLNQPYGMSVSPANDRLVVVEKNDGADDNIAVINTTDGSIVRRTTITGGTDLLDVALRDADGMFYASDRTGKRIYRGQYGTDNSEENYRYHNDFTNINALLFSSDEDYLFAGATNNIFSINVQNDEQPEEFITPPDNFDVDGLARIYGTMFIISSQTTREIYAVDTTSQRQFLSQLNAGNTPGYIYVDIETDDTYYLYVPVIEANEIRVFRITADYDTTLNE